MQYYCHECADTLRLLPNPPGGKVVRTPYQYGKHLKHTAPNSTYSIQSIFSDSSTSAYANYLVNAMLAGAVEIDEQGRKNIIWCAGRETGFQYQSGKLVRPSDAVKVVLPINTDKVHAFPENSTSFSTAICCQCGRIEGHLPYFYLSLEHKTTLLKPLCGSLRMRPIYNPSHELAKPLSSSSYRLCKKT